MAISACTFPLLLIAALPFARYTGTIVDRVHFLLRESDYQNQIAHLDQKAGERLAIFDWGGNPMVGVTRLVVYDESDEIMLPSSEQSSAFVRHMGSHGFTGHGLKNITRLAPHFYVADQ